ncbi:hypothetical protein D3C85_274550 [compost metagenome]
MSDIDWSKAPHDATHAAAGGYNNWSDCWYKQEGGQWFCWLMGREDQWDRNDGPCGRTDLESRPSKHWSGPQDGLPPVNQQCEIIDENTGEWLPGIVIAHGRDEDNDQAVIQCDNAIWMGHAHEFRPIRTQAQIEAEAEERQAAIQEMIPVAMQGADDEEICAALYDAGYRRTEK